MGKHIADAKKNEWLCEGRDKLSINNRWKGRNYYWQK